MENCDCCQERVAELVAEVHTSCGRIFEVCDACYRWTAANGGEPIEPTKS